MRIVWSQRAVADLTALHDYIAQDSQPYAERFVSSLVRAVEPLAEHPEMGRRVPEEPDRANVREILFRSYRLVHRIEASRILIASVIHGSRRISEFDRSSIANGT